MFNVENRAVDKSIVAAWCYHCKRCNYIWFPKDYGGYDTFGERGEIIDNGILDCDPPKSCARCKSKYWNQYPRRKTKYYDTSDEDWIMNPDVYRKIETLPVKATLYRSAIKFFEKLKENGILKNEKGIIENDEIFDKWINEEDKINKRRYNLFEWNMHVSAYNEYIEIKEQKYKEKIQRYYKKIDLQQQKNSQ